MNIGNTAHISGMLLGATIGLWACWGNKHGFKWLLASCAIVALGVTMMFWAPFNERYRMHKLSEKEDLNLFEAIKLRGWEADRDSLEPDE